MRPSADKIIVLTGASLFSLLFLELFCRAFLSLGNNYSETSMWQQEKWLEDHHGSQSTVAYTIDRYDSILGWTLKEGLTEQILVSPLNKKWIVNSNSKGARGKIENTYAKGSRFRILFIGDSYTFGECVNDSETIPYLTGQLLPGTEVINMAVHGYGNDQQYLRLLKEGLKFSPDLVVLGYVPIDPVRNHLWFRDYAKPYFELSGDSLQLRGTPVKSPEKYVNEWHLKSVSLIKSAYSRYFNKVAVGYSDPLTQKILDEMYKATTQNGAQMLAVYLPMDYECEKGKTISMFLMDSLCQNRNVKAVNPINEIHRFLLTQKKPASHFVCHYSVAINKIIAGCIARDIEEQLRDTSLNNIKPAI